MLESQKFVLTVVVVSAPFVSSALPLRYTKAGGRACAAPGLSGLDALSGRGRRTRSA